MEPKKRYILVVEDDFLQYRLIEIILKKRDLLSTMGIVRWGTEREFHTNIQELVNNKKDLPAIIILDVMLRWTKPNETVNQNELEDESPEDEYYRAGFRCLRRLRENPATKHIPVIIYSMLETDEIRKEWEDKWGKEPKLAFLAKDFDNELERRIRKLLH